jgi:hypothetical protein
VITAARIWLLLVEAQDYARIPTRARTGVAARDGRRGAGRPSRRGTGVAAWRKLRIPFGHSTCRLELSNVVSNRFVFGGKHFSRPEQIDHLSIFRGSICDERETIDLGIRRFLVAGAGRAFVVRERRRYRDCIISLGCNVFNQ